MLSSEKICQYGKHYELYTEEWGNRFRLNTEMAKQRKINEVWSITSRN